MKPDWNWIALLVFALLVLALPFFAHSHEANQPDAAWFNSLQQSNGIHCCGEADCRAYDEQTEVRINGGIYAVLYHGEWLPIPAARFLERSDNPTGHFVACVHDIGDAPQVLCAVKGTGA